MNYNNPDNLKEEELWNLAQEQIFAYIRDNCSGQLSNYGIELVLGQEFLEELEDVANKRKIHNPHG